MPGLSIPTMVNLLFTSNRQVDASAALQYTFEESNLFPFAGSTQACAGGLGQRQAWLHLPHKP